MISEYTIVKDKGDGKVYVLFKHEPKQPWSTLSPTMTVVRSYVHGDGTLGKFKWAQETKTAKLQIEVKADTEEAVKWVKYLEKLQHDVLDVMWQTEFPRKREMYPEYDTMPEQVRSSAVALCHATYKTLKIKRSLLSGPVPITNVQQQQLNKKDNTTPYVQYGDRVRVQLSVNPYVIREKTYGISLCLDGILKIASREMSSEMVLSHEINYNVFCSTK